MMKIIKTLSIGTSLLLLTITSCQSVSNSNNRTKQVAVLSTDSKVGNKTVYKTLIEIGTITNPLDAIILADKSNIKIFSEQLIKGLLEHIQNKFLL